MIIKKFKELFESCAKEVSMNGEVVDSHSGIPAEVRISCSNNDRYYTIEDVSIDYLFGCGCPGSVVIDITEDFEESFECYGYEEVTKNLKKFDDAKPTNEQDFVSITKIVVPTEYDKEQLLLAFKYIHNLKTIDTDYMAVNTIAHMYQNEILIQVEN